MLLIQNASLTEVKEDLKNNSSLLVEMATILRDIRATPTISQLEPKGATIFSSVVYYLKHAAIHFHQNSQ